MKLKALLESEERAVSPVIGVILMVAITVILAAVIGTFVLGLGDQVQTTTPNAQFSFDQDSSTPSIDITHDSGDAIDTDSADLFIVSGDFNEEWSDGQITAGDSVTIDSGSGETINEGDDIRVVWNSGDGDNSATLARQSANFEVSDAELTVN